jgi:hypothetical protein
MFTRGIKMVLGLILNVILLSIPEEIFIVGFMLILLNKTEFLGFGKQNIIRFSIPVVLSAVVSNILRFMGVNVNLVLVSSLVVCYISFILVYKMYKTFLNSFLSFVFLIISCITFIIIELYIPLTLNSIGMTVKEFNENIQFMFVLTIPERLIEYFLIYALSVKRNNRIYGDFDFNIYKEIFDNKKQYFISIASAVFVLFYCVWLSNVIYIYPSFNQFNLFVRTLTVAILLSIPILIVSINWYYINMISKSIHNAKRRERKKGW